MMKFALDISIMKVQDVLIYIFNYESGDYEQCNSKSL